MVVDVCPSAGEHVEPRSAWRRFVCPASYVCRQLDATEHVLSGGRTCAILQLIDDHSRYALTSHVAWSETAQAAIAVFDKAVTDCGVPQRLLSDNGAARKRGETAGAPLCDRVSQQGSGNAAVLVVGMYSQGIDGAHCAIDDDTDQPLHSLVGVDGDKFGSRSTPAQHRQICQSNSFADIL